MESLRFFIILVLYCHTLCFMTHGAFNSLHEVGVCRQLSAWLCQRRRRLEGSEFSLGFRLAVLCLGLRFKVS